MTEYVLGHTPAELERLVLQGRMYETATRELLQRAQLRPGMRVLDVGCGTGDVSMLVAEFVGPGGLVVGVDRAPEALEAARQRAEKAGVHNAEFVNSELDGLAADQPFDAVVGRFILMHQSEPAAFLRGLLPHLRSGGVVAFLESKMSASIPGIHSEPHSETYDRINRLKIAVIEAVGAHNDMAFRLAPTFVEAGLPYPSLRMHAYQDGGPDAVIPRFASASLKSMIPMLEAHGIASLTEAEVDEMERALVAELSATGGMLTSPLVVGACTRNSKS
jgi:ubiquinone/menaquinone biosynthesis C-methylase UbiE